MRKRKVHWDFLMTIGPDAMRRGMVHGMVLAAYSKARGINAIKAVEEERFMGL